MIYLFNPPKNPNAPIMAWLKRWSAAQIQSTFTPTYQDVPETWLGKALIESAEAMRRVDPKMYKWVWGGECVGVDELIYYMFNQSHIEDELPEAEKKTIGEIGIGIDYGQKESDNIRGIWH